MSVTPFVQHTHTPITKLSKVIFSPFKDGPQPILVKTVRQVIQKPPRPVGPPPGFSPNIINTAELILTTPRSVITQTDTPLADKLNPTEHALLIFYGDKSGQDKTKNSQ